MKYKTSVLNETFGYLFYDLDLQDLNNIDFLQLAYKKWVQFHGLVILRGEALANLSPIDLVSISQTFGKVDEITHAAREKCMVENFPILRIGNIKDKSGNLISQFSTVPQLKSQRDIQYNLVTQRPVWHTDSTFRPNPPIGSVFHCKKNPMSGGETLFADTRNGYETLSENTKSYLNRFEAVCSLAHHDKKVNKYSPDYPTLTPYQRLQNPPNRVPLVLNHPITKRNALYGLNSSTCAIVEKGQKINQDRMDEFDLKGEEDKSVLILKNLLPQLTSPKHTVCWQWEPGDIVVWDNRCTMHAGTGFDFKKYYREMWRLTLISDNYKNSEPLSMLDFH